MDEKAWWNRTASLSRGEGLRQEEGLLQPEMQILGPGTKERVSAHAHISTSAV